MLFPHVDREPVLWKDGFICGKILYFVDSKIVLWTHGLTRRWIVWTERLSWGSCPVEMKFVLWIDSCVVLLINICFVDRYFAWYLDLKAANRAVTGSSGPFPIKTSILWCPSRSALHLAPCTSYCDIRFTCTLTFHAFSCTTKFYK